MRLGRFVAALAAAAAVQSLGLSLHGGFFVAIDLFLVVAVYFSLDDPPVASMLRGTATGLVQDALTGGLFGLHGFADTLVAWAASRLRQRVVIQQPPQVGLLFALAAALQHTLLVALQYFMLPGSLLPGLGVMALRMVATGVAGALIYVVAGHIRRRLKAWRERRRRKLALEID
ncbi:MAG TPA: rod shape-determining protein MreD [Thermoanaerobaculia bacterium]|jgi:rod shape-determining protein MreD